MMLNNHFVKAGFVVLSRFFTYFVITPLVFLLFLPVAIFIVMMLDNWINSTALAVGFAVFILICGQAERRYREKCARARAAIW